ncbi:Brain-specific homeobox [Gossypium australe]|nr:Brain-specific homeobox [Gossypium australe]
MSISRDRDPLSIDLPWMYHQASVNMKPQTLVHPRVDTACMADWFVEKMVGIISTPRRPVKIAIWSFCTLG